MGLRGTPGIASPGGHAFFRDPHLLKALSPHCDTSVFTQTQCNATVPSWRSFQQSLDDALNDVVQPLPDHRSAASWDPQPSKPRTLSY